MKTDDDSKGETSQQAELKRHEKTTKKWARRKKRWAPFSKNNKDKAFESLQPSTFDQLATKMVHRLSGKQ